jgi:4a-hydroxytetrahydrobiopterin dehydratase
MTPESCVPCRSDLPPLTREECEKKLLPLPQWKLDDEARSISRRIACKDFQAALDIACRIGNLAEEMGHHPVLTVGWGFCSVKFKTAKINGLHNNDFVMAAHVDHLIK